jgi:hypothetical protein
MNTTNKMGIMNRIPPKYLALVALILQNSGLAISMRYTMIFSSPSTRYLTSSAVLVAEILKFIISFICCYIFDSNQGYLFTYMLSIAYLYFHPLLSQK